MSLEAIRYCRGENRLEILNQLKLPLEVEYQRVEGVEDAWIVIREMKVRGAPAIAIVAMLAVVVELNKTEMNTKSRQMTVEMVNGMMDHLITARPTAINLANACSQLRHVLHQMPESLVVDFAETMFNADVDTNKAIGRNGGIAILEMNKSKMNNKEMNNKEMNNKEMNNKLNLLTICNTGSLATAGYGTALGVARYLHGIDRLEMVYCLETRPYLQGARLSCFELLSEKIPVTLLVDSAAAWLMKTKQIDAVVVGADCVTLNGDTANKIGTYSLAILARHHGVPFLVCAPSTSINSSISDGALIPIEERPIDEVTHIQGIRIAPIGVSCWNPAFDVTPAELINAIVTEFGTFSPGSLGEKTLIT